MKTILLSVCSVMCLAAVAENTVKADRSAVIGAETNAVEEASAVEEIARRVHGYFYADIESAYWARGVIVDRNPYSAQFADLSFDLDPFGRIGGYVWSVSSLSRTGQSATRRNAYNEFDYAIHYSYRWQIAEGWALDSMVAKKWVTLPGYRPHAHSISEWNVSQALVNPYVTPYYLMRTSVHGRQRWSYWDVGLRRTFKLYDHLYFTALVFGELGDSRLFTSQYGANPNSADGSFQNGLLALNLLLRLDYWITDWCGIFAFVHQFDTVCDDARDALDRSSARQAVKDLTIGGIGLTFKF